MKYIFAFFSLVCSLLLIGYGQCTEEDKIIRTDPTDPFNSECAIDSPRFNFWAEQFTFYLGTFGPGGAVTVSNPYQQRWHFSSPNAPNYIDPDLLFNPHLATSFSPPSGWEAPEPGWELLSASALQDPQPPTGFGYFVLYNRFRSLIRVFFVAEPIGPGTAINVEVDFPTSGSSGGASGLLHPNRGMSQSMDQFSTGYTQVSVQNTNNFYEFMYVDIPVEYDPCTCTEASDLRFKFEKVDEQLIQLTGRYFGLNRTLAEIANSQVTTFEADYLTHVVQSATIDVNAGTGVYATYGKLLEKYNAVKQQNAQLENRYYALQAFEKAIKLVSVAGEPFLKAFKSSTTDLDIGGQTFTYSGETLLKTAGAGFNIFSAGIKKSWMPRTRR